jgi:heme-degrading monooxygenase HmoA
MIARIWHGKTPADRSDEYLEFLIAHAIPDYQDVPGNRGAYVLRRTEEGEAHFLTLTFWESEGAIRQFAGDDIIRAKYYPEDEGYLLEFEPNVVHYDVYGPP